MSTVQPPPSSPVQTAQPAAAKLPVLTVNNPPPTLNALVAGTPVSALVTTATAQGFAEITTSLGTFPVQTKLPLKADQPLVLQVAQTHGQIQGHLQGKNVFVFNVLEIAGKPTLAGQRGAFAITPDAGATGLASSTTTAGTTATSPSPTMSINLLVGSSISVTTLSPISAPVSTLFPAAPTPGPLGVNATTPNTTAQQASTALNTAPNTGTPPSQGNPVANPLTPGAPISNAGTTSSVGTPGSGDLRIFPTGSQFSVTVQSISPTPPSGTGFSTPPTSSMPFGIDAIIAGRISTHTLSGQAVIQTAHGSFAMGTTKSIPLGTEITIKVDTLPELTELSRTLSPALQRTGMVLSGTWPSLNESLNVIQSIDPSLSQQLYSMVLPKADIKLAATTLFFLSALRGGDVRGWIGENASRILERLRPDVMRRLGNDFRTLGDTDEGGGARRATEWRGTLIPFANGDAIEPIRLYTRQLDGDESGNDANENGTRFIVDITLSNIGRFQLDGIVETGDKRLDMIIRTASALPDQVRSDLMTLFSQANDTVGMRGGMVFQAAPESFVEPFEDVPRDSGDGIIV